MVEFSALGKELVMKGRTRKKIKTLKTAFSIVVMEYTI
jgi:hypothetical protein